MINYRKYEKSKRRKPEKMDEKIFESNRAAWNQATAFETGANHYSDGLDYFGNVKYELTEGFWFMHKMSEIISAILHNGMEMEEFEEYPFDLDGDYDQGAAEKFPFSYLITAKKK